VPFRSLGQASVPGARWRVSAACGARLAQGLGGWCIVAVGAQSAPPQRAAAASRYLDVALVVLAVPVALVLGAPTLGMLVGAAGWLAQRALAMGDRRLIAKAAPPGSRLGLNFIDAFGRIWLLAGAIIVAGVAGGRRDGLAATVLIFAAYSIALAVRLARGRPQVEAR
jgi:hypothetical protein